MSNFSNKIRSKYDHLTKTQKFVADYLLEHSDALAFTTLDELALRIGVSTTSVIRLARTLGYNGYVDMQKSFQNQFLNNVSLLDRFNDALYSSKQDQLLIDVFQNDINNIYATLSSLSEDLLSDTINSLINAEHIYILGTRGSFSVAHYLMHRLSQIKRNVRLVDGLGLMYPEQLASIGSNDLCISFLLPRYSKVTSDLLFVIKNQGVKIILFTKLGNTEMNSYGDVILPCQIKGMSYKNSLIALFSICNYLLAAVAIKDKENARNTIERTEKLLNGYYLGIE